MIFFRNYLRRITLPSKERFYGQIGEPCFLASLIKHFSDNLLHLALPQIDSSLPFHAATISCPSLTSISFHHSIIHPEHIFPNLLFACTALKSLTIHGITSEVLHQLQYSHIVSRLSNLSHLQLLDILPYHLAELKIVLISYSEQLQHITLGTKKNDDSGPLNPFQLTVETIVGLSSNLVRLQSLHVLDKRFEDFRKQLEHHTPDGAKIHDFLELLSLYKERRIPSKGTSLKTLRITARPILVLIAANRLLTTRSCSGKITLETDGITSIISEIDQSTSKRVVSIASIALIDLSSHCLQELKDKLRPRHIELGIRGRRPSAVRHYARVVRESPQSMYENVKSISIFVPYATTRIKRTYLDATCSVIRRLPQLESFEMSINAVLNWEMSAIESTMELVNAKKPRVIVIYTDDLLPPYLAIYCPSQGPRQRRAISRNRLTRLGHFIGILKSMDSVKEVIIEGDCSPKIICDFTERMAQKSEDVRERGLTARRQKAQKLLQEVTQMELERDMDMTSVIGWLESMVNGNKTENLLKNEGVQA